MSKWIKRGIGAALVAGLMLAGTVPTFAASPGNGPSAGVVTPQSPPIELPEEPEALAAH